MSKVDYKYAYNLRLLSSKCMKWGGFTHKKKFLHAMIGVPDETELSSTI